MSVLRTCRSNSGSIASERRSSPESAVRAQTCRHRRSPAARRPPRGITDFLMAVRRRQNGRDAAPGMARHHPGGRRRDPWDTLAVARDTSPHYSWASGSEVLGNWETIDGDAYWRRRGGRSRAPLWRRNGQGAALRECGMATATSLQSCHSRPTHLDLLHRTSRLNASQ